MSDAAWRARRNNLSQSRQRSDWESAIIKLLIWQSYFDGGPRPSQRALARQLGVWPSYVCKVLKQSAAGLDALTRGERATLNELDEARRFTARLKEQGLVRVPRALQRAKPLTPPSDSVVLPRFLSGHERLSNARLTLASNCSVSKGRKRYSRAPLRMQA